jgi:hypothetical protein
MNRSISRNFPDFSRLAAFWTLAGLFAVIALPQAMRAGEPAGWKSYTGNYFKIGVPPGFQVQPQGQPGSIGKYDELVLWNEELRVQFSVFSPQWNGEALFAKVTEGKEVLKSREEQTVKGVRLVQLDIVASDQSYLRFVVARTNLNENTNTTFGIRVPGMDVYEKVKPVYLKWKASLEQFAD